LPDGRRPGLRLVTLGLTRGRQRSSRPARIGALGRDIRLAAGVIRPPAVPVAPATGVIGLPASRPPAAGVVSRLAPGIKRPASAHVRLAPGVVRLTIPHIGLAAGVVGPVVGAAVPVPVLAVLVLAVMSGVPRRWSGRATAARLARPASGPGAAVAIVAFDGPG
jgi:hypothetical protein